MYPHLQVNTRWKALAEIYTMHSFAPFWNPKSKSRGKKNLAKTQPLEKVKMHRSKLKTLARFRQYSFGLIDIIIEHNFAIPW